MAAPVFVETNLADIEAALVADYEARVGKSLRPAQPEALLIKSFAYREYLLRQQMQQAALQMLVSFSTAPVLDYLAELVGVTRLPAAPAVCSILFTLVEGHAAVTIPMATRISSTDGLALFKTLDDAVVGVGVNTISVSCECISDGLVGNAYGIGAIKNILDPQAYLLSASNTAITSGGSDSETDLQLRSRIKLAPSSFSVAGPKNAYKFWAKSVSASIIDVEVTNPQPGTVAVYPLISGGVVTPTEILDAVAAKLDDENIRPLCDTVQVVSPTIINYTLNIGLIILPDGIEADIIAQVRANITAFREAKSRKLGGDIVGAAIIALCMVPNVYKPIINAFSDIIVSPTAVAVCAANDVTITVTGTNVG